MTKIAFALTGCLLLVALLVRAPEITAMLLFGWCFFLARVLPQTSIHWPSIAVSCTALGLLAAGVHWLGRSWLGQSPSGEGQPGRRWPVRASLAAVVVVLLAFASGAVLSAI